MLIGAVWVIRTFGAWRAGRPGAGSESSGPVGVMESSAAPLPTVFRSRGSKSVSERVFGGQSSKKEKLKSFAGPPSDGRQK